jgi:glycosyltransferase involved in cell wall biosynthesis
VPEVDVVLVGSGVQKARLRKAARDIPTVRFIDPIPKNEIPDLLHAADAGVHVLADVDLFRAGVSPNKVFDYMAAGLPIVTNSPGVVGDLVLTAEAGYVTEPGQLVDGLTLLVQAGHNELARRGAAGRRWIRDNQSRTAMALALADLLDQLVAPAGGARQ